MTKNTSLPLQNELLAVIQWFHAKGWAPATSTDYSFRNPAPHTDTYTISRSGVDKGAFALDDFIEVDRHGAPLEAYAGVKPSAEAQLHTLLYQLPEVQAVLHTHSVAATVYSQRHLAAGGVSIHGFELLKGLEGITTHETTLSTQRTLWPHASGDGTIEVLDQRCLPHEVRAMHLYSVETVVYAIREMVVRGAPLIGATAAYGVYFACRDAARAVDPTRNFGFDVTPARLVTALITERGVCAADEAGIAALFPERNEVSAPVPGSTLK